MANGDTLNVEILGYHWGRMAIRRTCAAFATIPVWGLRVLRWSARSPMRIAGFMGVLFLTEEVLRMMGIFQLLQDKVEFIYCAVMEVWLSAVEASETLNEWWKAGQAMYEAITEYVDPWKIPCVLVATYLAWKYSWEVDQSKTPLVTPGTTPGGSGETTPTEDSKIAALDNVASTINVQKELLTELCSKLGELAAQQQSLGQRMSDRQAKDYEEKVVEKERLGAQQEELKISQRRTWDPRSSRLEMFERILKEDRGDAAGGPAVEENIAGGESAKG